MFLRAKYAAPDFALALLSTNANGITSWAVPFLFLQNEGQEPPHIHIKAGEDQAKFWLDPITLATNYGFAARELNEISKTIAEHQAELVEA